MLNQLINIQYCYDYLLNQIPVSLLLYTHIPTALVAIAFGVFLLYKTREISSVSLFIVCFFFAVWCFLDLSSWFSYLGANTTMFTWGLVDLFALLFFFFSYYFLYSFLTKKDLPIWQKIVSVAILLPPIIWTFLGSNLLSFNANTCEAIENESISAYPYFVEGFFLLIVIFLVVSQYRKAKMPEEKREIMLAGTGVFIFLFFFFISTLSVNFLVNYDFVQYAYNFEIYGLFGMPLLLIFLVYVVVKYQAFNIRMIGAQALVVSLVALIGAQFFFIQNNTNRILNGVTLAISVIFGYYLVKGVKREIEARTKIQKLAEDLEDSNERQEDLIHFISHEVKGFLTKNEAIFAGIKEGDFGAVTPQLDTVVDMGFSDAKKGVETVMDILGASNLKKGTTTYTMKQFDLKKSLGEISESLRSDAVAKGLNFKLEISSDDFSNFKGDREQLEKHVFKNIIDNAIKYTPKGDVTVNLRKKDSRVLFSVKDSGIGITPEDKIRLFTEGGRGKDSTLVNVNSTGYGLFIAKAIVVAHTGKIWAESEGKGRGTTFYVELPNI